MTNQYMTVYKRIFATRLALLKTSVEGERGEGLQTKIWHTQKPNSFNEITIPISKITGDRLLPYPPIISTGPIARII